MEAKSGSVINATGCATYSNSKASNSIAVKDSSVLRSAYVCAGGGYEGNTANYTNLPKTDCPAFADPLAGRAPPPMSSNCD